MLGRKDLYNFKLNMVLYSALKKQLTIYNMKKKLTDFAVAMTFLAIFLGAFAIANLLDSLIK